MRSLLAASVVALLVALPSSVSACSCTNEPTFERAVQSSDAIFLGEVIEVRDAAPQYSGAVWAVIRVDAAWKGAPPETVEVLTGENSAICGFPFRPALLYLVYAFRADAGTPWTGPVPGILWTHLCWRTHITWPDDPDLAALGSTPVRAVSWGAVKQIYR